MLAQDLLGEPKRNAREGIGVARAGTRSSTSCSCMACRTRMTTEFANAVQEALSGLEKIAVKGDEIKQALLQGGSPATPDDLRKRFDTFMNERCKGKDATKLRFVIE